MRSICAWCLKGLENGTGEGNISHGICPRCLEYALSSRTSIRDFLNKITAPVLAVDGEGRAIAANDLALGALGKTLDQVEGRLGGEVIECEHAYAPEKCGNTIHCTGCQIRGSVNHTRATGESLIGVRAFQHIMTPTGVKTFEYHVSTEKLRDGTILLRIDEAAEIKQASA
jgi:PAS domain-containing protein